MAIACFSAIPTTIPRSSAAICGCCRRKRIDGLVIASAGEDAVLAQSLAGSREPLVILDRNIEGVSADLVQIDHEKGGYLATRHLLQLGHSRIGCITGPIGTAVSAMRVHGFIRAMAERGIDIEPNAIVQNTFSAAGGYEAATQLFETLRPTGIFACNDMMGVGALRAAAEQGINVPRDCSIIGFDDIELSRYTYPALSTVGQSVRELGEMAAQTLIDRIAGQGAGYDASSSGDAAHDPARIDGGCAAGRSARATAGGASGQAGQHGKGLTGTRSRAAVAGVARFTSRSAGRRGTARPNRDSSSIRRECTHPFLAHG